MKELKFDWLTEGLIDFEYKKYILLAYLKEVRHNFSMNRLYPYLSDLVFHYRNLQQIQNNKKMIFEKLTKLIFLNRDNVKQKIGCAKFLGFCKTQGDRY